MKNVNVGGIFFTENTADFGTLFNEFNIYIRQLDVDLATKEQIIYELSDLPSTPDVIQALDSYGASDLDDLKTQFEALNDAFDSIAARITTALNSIIT